MIVTAVLNFPPLPCFLDLRARLLSFEAQISVPSQPTNAAFMAAQHRGSSSSSSVPRSSSQWNHGGSISCQWKHGGGGSSGQWNHGGGSSSSQWNHGGGNYRNHNRNKDRDNRSSAIQTAPDSGLLGPPPRTIAPQSSQQALVMDPNWYPDTGATHHMTRDSRPVHNRTPYADSDSIP
ncbi:hypothetical protein Vadar_004316 [Vaccinium darrowii]|uniref:Uncharacterized protein n=1 Tax=Vaccinium darrowii TaxID=229202 RepID=A0ACB7Y4U9_9ERIC|nr:hypothetical protein Vadar_004316 [Vaccinium darrowii]